VQIFLAGFCDAHLGHIALINLKVEIIFMKPNYQQFSRVIVVPSSHTNSALTDCFSQMRLALLNPAFILAYHYMLLAFMMA